MILSSGCKFFGNHRLFSKDIDTLLDAEEAPKTAIMDTTPVLEQPPAPSYNATQKIAQGYGSDKYYMIVGSFQNENLANRYAKKIQQMGYQVQVIESSGGFYRVSAKSFNNFRTGVDEIDNFRSSVVASAWLHVQP